MKLKLTREQAIFAKFVVEERRMQFKSLTALHERHNRPEAKKMLDTFPFGKGRLIPYVNVKDDDSVMTWDNETHEDLLHDLREHLAERTSWPDKGDVRPAHEVLAKVEAATSTTKR
jgi:hypothetical protein